jgi:hypothetical protein
MDGGNYSGPQGPVAVGAGEGAPTNAGSSVWADSNAVGVRQAGEGKDSVEGLQRREEMVEAVSLPLAPCEVPQHACFHHFPLRYQAQLRV